VLNPDGSLYTANLRKAKATDTYVCSGAPHAHAGLRGRAADEVWEPRFTFHGFRYVEANGLPKSAGAESITGIVLHSASQPSGEFSCSNAILTQLQRNIVWGQRGNFLEIPTDCPQRDERLGWTGDAQIFIRTACFNYDVAAFFTKWLIDLDDSQKPDGRFPDVAPDVVPAHPGGVAAWADAGVICPWQIYVAYGDKRVLQRHYPAMCRYVKYLQADAGDDFLRPAEGYGDWVAVGSDTAKDLVATAYFAHVAALMSKTATVLEKPVDARRFALLYRRIKRAFQREFVTAAGRVSGETQTAYVLALVFELLQDHLRAAAATHLAADVQRRGRLTTGFVGSRDLVPALADSGHVDLAYKLLLREEFPSWGYPIAQGATTIWERWDGWTAKAGFQDPGMNSFNHYAYGAIGQFLYERVAGIAPDEDRPGYKHLRIEPLPGGGITHAAANLRTIHGPASVAWRINRGRMRVEVEVPANTSATVTLPTPEPQSVTESRKPLANAEGVSGIETVGSAVRFDISAGRYAFECKAPAEAR
jgi:alpha-L-rhamnosidase